MSLRMKRRNYDIDGDTVSNNVTVPRYKKAMYWECVSQSPLLRESYFSWLPGEVIGLIARHTLLHETKDFQLFLRYLLPMFGISLSVLRTTYTSSQKRVLSMMQDVLTIGSPRLFKECLRERLRRISVCVDSLYGNFTTNVEQLTSVKIISHTLKRRAELNTRWQTTHVQVNKRRSFIYLERNSTSF